MHVQHPNTLKSKNIVQDYLPDLTLSDIWQRALPVNTKQKLTMCRLSNKKCQIPFGSRVFGPHQTIVKKHRQSTVEVTNLCGPNTLKQKGV